jgi:glycosyltransferase involved in cell wall biosynthesis
MSSNSNGFLLSLIIPVYNEESGIDHLIQRLDSFINNKFENTEVIFVDDHSSDNSARLLKLECQRNPAYHFIRLSKNSGSHIAIIAGMGVAKGDCAVFLAADLQDPPELIVNMIDKWRDGNKIVWAVRDRIDGISMSTALFSRLFYFFFNKMSYLKLPKTGADFALLDRQVVDALIMSADAKPSLGALINWLGFKQTEILYTKEERRHGKSKWTLSKKINAFIDSIVSFSYAPMRIMIGFGLLVAAFGFLYSLFIVGLNLLGDPVEGWSSIIVAVLILGGTQMIMLGVLGEYLWRNLEESRKRPLYFIEDSSY